MDDRSFLRSGAFAAVAGGILALAGNLLHPRYPNVDNVVMYPKIAKSQTFVIADLIIVVALVLVIAGFVALAQFAGGAFGRWGRDAALVGGAIALASTGVEMYGLRQQAILFASAKGTNQVAAFWATDSINHLNIGTFAIWTLVFLGIAPLCIGVASIGSKRFPAWLNAMAVLGGLICGVVGVAGLFLSDQNPLNIPFLVGSLLVTLWVIFAGLQLFGKAASSGLASAQPG